MQNGTRQTLSCVQTCVPFGRLVVPEVCRNSATSSGRALSSSDCCGAAAMCALPDLARSSPLPEDAMRNQSCDLSYI